jgi:hypothetical protein
MYHVLTFISFVLSLFCIVRGELEWAVYVCFSILGFLFRPSMVLNQRQVSLVISD